MDASRRQSLFTCRMLVVAIIATLLLLPTGGSPAASPINNNNNHRKRVSISVSYGGQTVKNGERLQPSDTPVPPTLYLDAGSDNNGQTSYAVVMIDRKASRQPGSAQLTYVHYWVVVLAQGRTQPARVETVIAPYVRPAPHDSLEHPYQIYVYDITTATTSPPSGFLEDRFVQDYESLIQNQKPLGSTSFTEQIEYPASSTSRS